jgi:hypothetical protein
MGERLAWFDLAPEIQKHRPHCVIDAAVGDCHVEDGLCLGSDRIPDAERLEHTAGRRRDGGSPDIIACPAKTRIREYDRKIIAECLSHGDGERKPGKSAPCDQDVRAMIWRCGQNAMAFQQNAACGATPLTPVVMPAKAGHPINPARYN